MAKATQEMTAQDHAAQLAKETREAMLEMMRGDEVSKSVAAYRLEIIATRVAGLDARGFPGVKDLYADMLYA